jgi:outer membrane protein OmpA-like peptidoglycan-associated protein
LKILLILTAFVGLILNLKAQNLVPNPGFELFYDCPDGLRQLKKTKHWYSGNIGTPEYFRTDCKYQQGPAQSGKAYTGLILFGDYPKAIEYLMVELTDSLQKDSIYCLSYWVRAEESFVYIDQIGMHLSDNNLKITSWSPIQLSPSLISKYGNPIIPQLGWMEIKGEYKAKGGERYLSIGNFNNPDRIVKHYNEFYHRKPGWNSYYYFDDVSVSLKESAIGCTTRKVAKIHKESSPQRARQPDTLMVCFESDSYLLNSSEKNRLKNEMNKFNMDEVKRLVLMGHTDADGSDGYNLKLSEQRILQVKEYLLAILPNSKPIKLNYFGEANPVAGNDTEAGKAKNRRVEVILEFYD